MSPSLFERAAVERAATGRLFTRDGGEPRAHSDWDTLVREAAKGASCRQSRAQELICTRVEDRHDVEDRAIVLMLVILSPCLLGLAPLRRIYTGQSAISKVSRTAAATRFARWRPSFSFCEISMTKLYVGNLPFTATEEGVRNLFAPHGTV